ncbi:MAG: CpsD/CapB family tyrosine-protein kinase [Clostridium sp.]|nr:CpsD/CapB family tyrosine-protein kinase [Clostridium sp.]
MFWNRKKQNQKLFADVTSEQQSMIGSNLNFAASEAYKLLRTNLEFSFTDDEEQKIIGITSSLKGEGKSITAINLAYTIAEAGKKVLLMECDMRLPTVSKRLNLKSSKGLSNLLVGMNAADEVVQEGVLSETMDVIPAGDIPPNASELLASKRMEYTLEYLSKYYDYILLDLPPVTVVADALVASKLVSGMVVVVRQDYVGRAALSETMRQLKYVNAKVLGFVFNSVDDHTLPYNKRYYRKGYYKGKYGYQYGYQYGYGQKEDQGTKQKAGLK